MSFSAAADASLMESFVSQPPPSFIGADSAPPLSFWETVPTTTASAQTPPSSAMAATGADAFRTNTGTRYATNDLFAVPSRAPAVERDDGHIDASQTMAEPRDRFSLALPMGCETTLLPLPATTEPTMLNYLRAPLAPLTANTDPSPQSDLSSQAALPQPSVSSPAMAGPSLFSASSPWGSYLFEPACLGAATGSALSGVSMPSVLPPASSTCAGTSDQALRVRDEAFSSIWAPSSASTLDRADPATPSETGPTRRAHRSGAPDTLDAASGGVSGGRSRAKGRFPCQFCETVVSRMDSLTRHLKRKHPQQVTAAGGNIGLGPLGIPALTPSRSSSVSTASSPGSGLVCSLCHLQLTRYDSLFRHLKIEHGQDMSRFPGPSPE